MAKSDLKQLIDAINYEYDQRQLTIHNCVDYLRLGEYEKALIKLNNLIDYEE